MTSPTASPHHVSDKCTTLPWVWDAGAGMGMGCLDILPGQSDTRTGVSGQWPLLCSHGGHFPSGLPQLMSTAGALGPGHSSPTRGSSSRWSLLPDILAKAFSKLPQSLRRLLSLLSFSSFLDLPHGLTLSPTTSATNPHHPSQCF